MFVAAMSVNASPRWEKKSYNVYIKDNPKTYVMKKAFNRWQSITNKDFTFTYVTTPENADITSDFVTDLPGMAVGVCHTNYKGDKIVKADIELAEKNKYKSILTDDEYFRIMLHEIGHALGLPHSTSLNSIMRTNTMEITNISIEDKKDLEELYR